jgi:hypothetical protein
MQAGFPLDFDVSFQLCKLSLRTRGCAVPSYHTSLCFCKIHNLQGLLLIQVQICYQPVWKEVLAC